MTGNTLENHNKKNMSRKRGRKKGARNSCLMVSSNRSGRYVMRATILFGEKRKEQ